MLICCWLICHFWNGEFQKTDLFYDTCEDLMSEFRSDVLAKRHQKDRPSKGARWRVVNRAAPGLEQLRLCVCLQHVSWTTLTKGSRFLMGLVLFVCFTVRQVCKQSKAVLPFRQDPSGSTSQSYGPYSSAMFCSGDRFNRSSRSNYSEFIHPADFSRWCTANHGLFVVNICRQL